MEVYEVIFLTGDNDDIEEALKTHESFTKTLDGDDYETTFKMVKGRLTAFDPEHPKGRAVFPLVPPSPDFEKFKVPPTYDFDSLFNEGEFIVKNFQEFYVICAFNEDLYFIQKGGARRKQISTWSKAREKVSKYRTMAYVTDTWHLWTSVDILEAIALPLQVINGSEAHSSEYPRSLAINIYRTANNLMHTIYKKSKGLHRLEWLSLLDLAMDVTNDMKELLDKSILRHDTDEAVEPFSLSPGQAQAIIKIIGNSDLPTFEASVQVLSDYYKSLKEKAEQSDNKPASAILNCSFRLSCVTTGDLHTCSECKKEFCERHMDSSYCFDCKPKDLEARKGTGAGIAPTTMKPSKVPVKKVAKEHKGSPPAYTKKDRLAKEAEKAEKAQVKEVKEAKVKKELVPASEVYEDPSVGHEAKEGFHRLLSYTFGNKFPKWVQVQVAPHPKWKRTLPDGHKQVTTGPATPSDMRSWANCLSDLRKKNNEARLRMGL